MATRRRRRATWASYPDSASFFLDCQAVVALRMVRICTGGDDAAREATRMVSEKVHAFAAAQIDAVAGFQRSGLPGASAAVARRYRRAVAGNRRRLLAGE